MNWQVTTSPVLEPVSLHDVRVHLRISSGTEIALDFEGVAVDETGGIVSLPVNAHGLSQSGGTRIVVSGTDNYDGVHVTTDDTTADKIAFVGTYVAETFGTTEFVYTGGDTEEIQSIALAAREYCELYTNRAFITQTITAYLDSFSQLSTLPMPPLQSVTSIKYLDSNGDQQTLSVDVYDVDKSSEPGIITLAYNQTWPITRTTHNAIEIIYVAGYGDNASDVPERITSAMKLWIGHLYENRESVTPANMSEIPQGVRTLLSIDRIY